MTALPVVMGVVNVTPDSFSDGGLYADAASAIAHGRQLLADGADILDVGGESTRPGATRPLVEEELDRVVPVITALAEDGATVSVDTMRHQVAAAALAAGASIVNDVSGGLADPEILRVVADAEATYVAMHWRAHADHMTDFATYDNPGGVVAAVRDELAERVDGGAGRGGRAGAAGPRPRAGIRQARRRTTGSCWPTSGRSRRWGTRCWSAPAASRSSAPCSPTRTATPARWTAARTPPPPSAWCSPGRGCGGCACTTYAPLATPCECCTHSTPLGRRAST